VEVEVGHLVVLQPDNHCRTAPRRAPTRDR
jgi:hypothetical protein